ncbi:unnamed protein product [marine sediment metagenome]|uniref:Uncharacterized protein n=1 Tax=marine sediment metagenome TaxID=412755 RepID=X1S8B6_9ZZZZ
MLIEKFSTQISHLEMLSIGDFDGDGFDEEAVAYIGGDYWTLFTILISQFSHPISDED